MGKIWRGKSFLVTVIILVLITSSFVFAQENSKNENEVLELSLKEALEIAEENNQQIKLSELNLEKAKLGKKQYRYQDKKVKDAVDMWKSMTPEAKLALQNKMIEEMGEIEGRAYYEMYISEMESLSGFDISSTMDLSEKRVEVGEKLAEAGIDVTVKSIHFGVEAAYYGALSAKENTIIAKAALDRQKDMLKIAQAKYNVGTVAKKEV
ncbi:MAG TPA: TolC family protein, partial [Thermoanaerobacterales bacterium]|nr:TolC family protein [Thermoanaerobacterales bacterium]